jgi:hypothetical protein
MPHGGKLSAFSLIIPTPTLGRDGSSGGIFCRLGARSGLPERFPFPKGGRELRVPVLVNLRAAEGNPRGYGLPEFLALLLGILLYPVIRNRRLAGHRGEYFCSAAYFTVGGLNGSVAGRGVGVEAGNGFFFLSPSSRCSASCKAIRVSAGL